MAQKLTAADFDPEVLVLFDAYVHGALDRRGFLDKAKRYCVGSVTAAMLLDSLSPKFAEAQQVKTDDPRLETSFVEFPSPQGTGKARGYLVRPANSAGKKLPAILVVHENRGLNPHIEDIARRIGLDGYMAFAPDALFPVGGYPGNEDKARELFQTLDQPKTREDFVAAAHWLRRRDDATGRIGAVGFCYGGAIVNMLATRVPELAAAVPFYGGAPPIADVPKIKAALLLQFAESDERVNAAWPPYEAALKAQKIPYEAHIYPGTQHGFNNDTTPRFDEKAAKLAWDRTMAHFAKHVKG
jgi:carboxymethylenebutenolidase